MTTEQPKKGRQFKKYCIKFKIDKNTFKEFNDLKCKEACTKLEKLFDEYYGIKDLKISYDKLWNMANRPKNNHLLYQHFCEVKPL